jgi:2-dehydropantoate 2-reductase
VAVPESAWDELVEVCRRTAINRSSMLQDVESGRETEIEAINGSLVRLARRHGILAPLNETMADLIRGMRLQ